MLTLLVSFRTCHLCCIFVNYDDGDTERAQVLRERSGKGGFFQGPEFSRGPGVEMSMEQQIIARPA